MEEKKSNKRKINYATAAVILIVVAILAVALWLLLSKNEVRTSEEGKKVSTGALYCTAKEPKDPFFVSEKAVEATHKIKVTFKNGEVDKLSYNYQGFYNSEDEADKDRTTFHASYNTYMGENGVSPESLTPIFDYSGSKSRIDLFAEQGKSLNVVTAKLFFLSISEYEDIDEYNEEKLEKVYVGKGFSCTFND